MTNTNTLQQLLADCARIRGFELRQQVANRIGSGYDNANLTVFVEKACPESDWNRIFTGSIASLLACEESSARELAWFAKRGIRP